MALISLQNGSSFLTQRNAINANFAALVPAVTTVAVSGASQTLAFTGLQETYYDVTLTAACAISLGVGTPGQSIIVVFHGAYAWTGPAGAFYANGLIPVPQCSALLIDIMQYTVLPSGAILGTPIVLGAAAPSLAISAFSGTTYAGASLAVSGTYVGSAPTNLDYAIDGGAYTTLAGGAATITNGTFSFSVTAPAAGSHTILVRATGTSEVSPSQALTIAAPAVPAAPTLSVTSGNALNTITWTDNSANGSAITGHKLYRGTTSGGESLIGTISTASPYSDTGLTNGTAYYYKLSAVNGIGEGSQSTEQSATPSAGSGLVVPAHYLAGTSSANAVATTAPAGPTDYYDLIAWVAPTSYTSGNWILSRWAVSNNGSSNSAYGFYLDTSGFMNIATFGTSTGSNTFTAGKSTVALTSAITPSATNGIWLRCQINLSGAAITAVAGSPVASIPSGGCVFSYANPTSVNADSNTWVQLGTTNTGLGSGGFAAQTITPTLIGTSAASVNSFTGKFYKGLIRNSAGAILTNPDFSGLATGATTLTDTAPTPISYTITAGAET